MTRFTSAMVLAAAASLALAGCSSGGDTGSGSDAGVAPTDLAAEITYAFWDENQRAAIERNVEDFNELYPGIEVTLNVTPWNQYWTKLQTQAESSSLPDVFWMNGPNVALYGSNGMLEPMDSFVANGQLDPADYPEAMNEIYTVDGVQYAIPKDFDTVGLWFNKALFERAGVDLPTADWTWDDFHTAAKAISDALGDEGVYGVSTPLGGQEAYYNSILQAGGEIISEDKSTSGFDSPEAIEGLQLWADLVADGSSPTPQQLSDTEGKVMFASGRSAMVWTGTWAVSQFLESEHADDFDVVDLPTGERKATVIHGVANSVSAHSANKSAAMAFAAYLGSEEAQVTQAEMGAANPAFNGTQQAFVDSAPNWNLQVFEDATEYAYPYPVSTKTQEWNEVETTSMPAAFEGKKPVADVAGDVAAQMNEILATE